MRKIIARFNDLPRKRTSVLINQLEKLKAYAVPPLGPYVRRRGPVAPPRPFSYPRLGFAIKRNLFASSFTQNVYIPALAKDNNLRGAPVIAKVGNNLWINFDNFREENFLPLSRGRKHEREIPFFPPFFKVKNFIHPPPQK